MSTTNDDGPEPRYSPDKWDHDRVVTKLNRPTTWHVDDGSGTPCCGGGRASPDRFRTRSPEIVSDSMDACQKCLRTGSPKGDQPGWDLQNKLQEMEPEDLGLEGPP